jgi:uncharacterized protein YbjT (DUF2867 family)
MAKILIAGATGAVGKELIKALNSSEHELRALVRNSQKLAQSGIPETDIFIADARTPESLQKSCDGIAVVISAIGASLQLGLTKDRNATYFDVDFQANKNLLDEAKRAGVEKFIYVSAFKANENAGIAYFEAHAAFEKELKNSGLEYAIIRPTGIFYIFAEFIRMARMGIMPMFGDGSARTNPIQESEVAEACVNAITSKETEFNIGGSEIFTRRELGELCFTVLKKKPRFIAYPIRLLRFMIKPIALFDRRLFEFLDFGISVNTQDFVAPEIGEKKLESYLRQLTREP